MRRTRCGAKLIAPTALSAVSRLSRGQSCDFIPLAVVIHPAIAVHCQSHRQLSGHRCTVPLCAWRRNCEARGQLSAGTSRPGNRCSGSRPGGSSSVYRVAPRDQPRRRKKQMKTARKARNNTITVTGSEGRRKVKFARNRNIVKCRARIVNC